MMLGLWPLSYTAMLAAAVVVLVMQAMILPVAGALFVRYLLVIAIFRPAAIKMGQPIHLAWLAPLLEMQTVTLNALIFFTNLIQKPKKWN